MSYVGHANDFTGKSLKNYSKKENTTKGLNSTFDNASIRPALKSSDINVYDLILESRKTRSEWISSWLNERKQKKTSI